MEAGPASPNQEGPSEAPPPLPEGWLAQWDSNSRKYYFVQRATGHSQWDVPTQPALSVPTPEPTPQAQSPFQKPDAAPYEGADRGLLGDLAVNAIMGGKHGQKPQSGLEGLAGSLLGGQSHSSSGQTGGGQGGFAGQLIGNFLGGGGKPSEQTSQGTSAGFSSPTTGYHHSSGISGMASSLFGGGQGASQQNDYGYTPSGYTVSGGYTGSAPPTSYTPSNQGNNPYSQGHSQQQVQQAQPSTTNFSHQQYQPTSEQSYVGPPPNHWGSEHPAPYSQQNKPYVQQNTSMYGQQSAPTGTPNQGSTSGQNYNSSASGQQPQYQSPPYQGQYNQYPPPPQHTPSFPPPPSQGSSQNPYSSPPPPPPMNTHPTSAGHPIGQAQPYAGHSYPGQQSFGQGPQSSGYSPATQPSGYGQEGSQYHAYGAPPPPAWR